VEPLRFVAVPVPTLEKFWFRFRFRLRLWFRFRIQTIIKHSYPKTKKLHKSLPFQGVRSSLFPKKVALSSLIILPFFLPFYVTSRSKSDSGTWSGTVMHSGSGSTKQKVTVPVPAPQHCRKETLRYSIQISSKGMENFADWRIC
jgi:hypothetical protein